MPVGERSSKSYQHHVLTFIWNHSFGHVTEGGCIQYSGGILWGVITICSFDVVSHKQTFVRADDVLHCGVVLLLPKEIRTVSMKSSIRFRLSLYINRCLSGGSAGLTYMKYRFLRLTMQAMNSRYTVLLFVLVMSIPVPSLIIPPPQWGLFQGATECINAALWKLTPSGTDDYALGPSLAISS